MGAQSFRHFSVEEALSHYETLRSERVNWITTTSDGPMKMRIYSDPRILPTILQKIREKGPLNVLGWKQLLANNPMSELPAYIETCQREGKRADAEKKVSL